MTIQEAMKERHSVRKYVHKPLNEHIVSLLQSMIDDCNKEGGLNIQLVTNEPKAFSGMMAYGKFAGVENYFVMAGKKSPTLDERIGYYGEKLVLSAQQLGLNTCWAGISYRKVKGVYVLGKDEKIACMIALGYGENQGISHKSKTCQKVSNWDGRSPEWLKKGVTAALLAPTAINQQKFYFEYIKSNDGSLPKVKASALFSIVGYTQMDLGIAKLHFEEGAGKENFEWV